MHLSRPSEIVSTIRRQMQSDSAGRQVNIQELLATVYSGLSPIHTADETKLSSLVAPAVCIGL